MAITITKIAELCGVSRGTVDRALNNKGNVRPEVCARIKRVAAEHGYTPNQAGRALVRARAPLRLGIVIHSTSTAFMQLLLHFSQAAAAELAAFGVEVSFRLVSGLDPDDMLRQVDDLVEHEHITGLAITPLAHISIQQKINDLSDRLHIPVVTFNSDLPNSKRLCYIGQDNVAAGRTAAGLMQLLLNDAPAKVLPITGSRTINVAYNERLFGFMQEFALQCPQHTLLPMQDCCDRASLAEQLVLEALQAHPDLSGIYVASTGYEGVCRALIQAGRQSQIKVIAHDLVAHNLSMARQQVLDFVIGQDARAQGALPLQYLQRYADTHETPARTIHHTAIEVRFHYNITEQDCLDAMDRQDIRPNL